MNGPALTHRPYFMKIGGLYSFWFSRKKSSYSWSNTLQIGLDALYKCNAALISLCLYHLGFYWGRLQFLRCRCSKTSWKEKWKGANLLRWLQVQDKHKLVRSLTVLICFNYRYEYHLKEYTCVLWCIRCRTCNFHLESINPHVFMETLQA